MAMETTLTALALADAGLIAEFGEGIYWQELPRRDRAKSLIFHPLSSSGEDYHHGGRSGLSEQSVQADCWATTALEAFAARDRLVAFVDTLTAAPLQAFIQRRHGSADPAAGPAPDTRSTTLFRASLDLQVWFSETA